MEVDFANFTKREVRTAYIARRFYRYLNHSVLDVGCDQANLKRYLLPGVDYFGIDIGGVPDMRVDLEKVGRLPFKDSEYFTVVCSDVLEHLDCFHHMFEELIRVAKKYIIISLPNCWVNARRPIERGRGSFSYYGLPLEPPIDRHKWFFSLTDIEQFMLAKKETHRLQIREMHATEKPRLSFVRHLRRLRYPNQRRYLNRYAHTLWTLFEK